MIDHGFGFDSAMQQADEDTFVEVCYAQSLKEAAALCKLLEDRAIATLVETDPALPDQCGVAVLVHADRLVEASEILTLDAHDHDVCTVADSDAEPDILDLDSPDSGSDPGNVDDDDDDDDAPAIDLFEDHPGF